MVYLKFQDEFKAFGESNKYDLNQRKTGPQHWYDLSFGRSDCHISLTINSQKKEIACEIYIPNSKETFTEFSNYRNEIEASQGKLIWMELPTKKANIKRRIHRRNPMAKTLQFANQPSPKIPRSIRQILSRREVKPQVKKLNQLKPGQHRRSAISKNNNIIFPHWGVATFRLGGYSPLGRCDVSTKGLSF